MKAIEIIGRLREKYSNKYTRTPNKDKDHYISWLQDEYAELVMKQANGVNTEQKALHIDSVIARFSDELIDSVIHELNAYGHNYDHYEFGLPTYDEHMDNMRNIVKVKLNGL